MVVIRLSRGGAKKRPFYKIVVADRRARRDGGFIERIGFFNPIAVGGEKRLELDKERVKYWLSQGACLSDRVQSLVDESDKPELIVKRKAKKEARVNSKLEETKKKQEAAAAVAAEAKKEEAPKDDAAKEGAAEENK